MVLYPLSYFAFHMTPENIGKGRRSGIRTRDNHF